MNTLTVSNNIFQNKIIALDYLQGDTFSEDTADQSINWLQLKISEPDHEEDFKSFHKAFIHRLKQDFAIYWCYFDSFKERRSRIRSHAKLFYHLKKDNLVSEQYLREKELVLNENESILTGVIKIDELDEAIVFNELAGKYFKFGYASLSNQKNNKPIGLDDLDNKLDLDVLKVDDVIRINSLKLIQKLITPFSLFYTYLYDGKDDLVFTIYAGAHVYEKVEQLILNSRALHQKTVRQDADPKEVERLIALYYKDWKGPKK